VRTPCAVAGSPREPARERHLLQVVRFADTVVPEQPPTAVVDVVQPADQPSSSSRLGANESVECGKCLFQRSSGIEERSQSECGSIFRCTCRSSDSRVGNFSSSFGGEHELREPSGPAGPRRGDASR
jgi:hypothetical protein